MTLIKARAISVMSGVRQITTEMRATETSAAVSTVGSVNGAVSLQAGNDVHIKAVFVNEVVRSIMRPDA